LTVIVAVVPALDEEANIGGVVTGIARYVHQVVVVDNGSADRTAACAAEAGADVVIEPRRGYGRACLAGIERARTLQADIVLFLDGDGSDDPADAPRVLQEVLVDRADITLGNRTRELTDRGAMTSVQRFGNWFAPLLMRLAVGARYRDMPPFKACSMRALDQLGLKDTGHGFTIELMMKAHRHRLRVEQVSVRCHARKAGVSKVSGNLRGATRAAFKITSSIARHTVRYRYAPDRP